MVIILLGGDGCFGGCAAFAGDGCGGGVCFGGVGGSGGGGLLCGSGGPGCIDFCGSGELVSLLGDVFALGSLSEGFCFCT